MKSQLYLWSRWVLYVGRSFDTHEHTHHAVQLTLGLDGPLQMNKDTDDQLRLPAVVISSETPHSLQAEGHWVASIYLEPEAEDYERLVDYYPGDPSGGFRALSVKEEYKAQFLGLLESGVNPTLAQQLVRKLIEPTAIAESQPLDPRIIKVLRYLNRDPGLNIPVAELAKHVSLSPDRLAHLFRQEIGTPIRRFVLWQKLRLAAKSACQGKPLIYAAQEGGFTDSAHFTHSFQKLFGINPSFLFSPQNQLIMYVE